jgi:hypothetical protein
VSFLLYHKIYILFLSFSEVITNYVPIELCMTWCLWFNWGFERRKTILLAVDGTEVLPASLLQAPGGGAMKEVPLTRTKSQYSSSCSSWGNCPWNFERAERLLPSQRLWNNEEQGRSFWETAPALSSENVVSVYLGYHASVRKRDTGTLRQKQ